MLFMSSSSSTACLGLSSRSQKWERLYYCTTWRNLPGIVAGYEHRSARTKQEKCDPYNTNQQSVPDHELFVKTSHCINQLAAPMLYNGEGFAYPSIL